MPAMPDPTSDCPIFGRLFKATADPLNVEKALLLLKKPAQGQSCGDLIVTVAQFLSVVDSVSFWNCGARGKLSESEYLEKIWFDENDGWWMDHQPVCDDFLSGLKRALRLSYNHTKATGKPCPIKGVWVCVDDDFKTKVKLRNKHYDSAQVWFAVFTPPPEEECVPA